MNQLYLVTVSGGRHEDHVPVIICDQETLSSRYVFLSHDGVMEEIKNMKPGQWLHSVSICTEKLDHEAKKELDQALANDDQDVLRGFFGIGNILMVAINEEISGT